MKFILFAEGPTEARVVPDLLRRWLDGQLTQRVGIDPRKFGGWSDMVDQMPKLARMYLDGPQKDEIIAVIALLDLYGPNIYPLDKTTAAARRKWAVADLERKVDHPRFRMFFAVHELEAWLPAQPSILPTAVRDSLPKSAAKPEGVNFKEPPAKLLERLYLRHTRQGYRKVVDGEKLFPRLDPTGSTTIVRSSRRCWTRCWTLPGRRASERGA